MTQATHADRPSLSGNTRYETVCELGAGGMSTVALARKLEADEFRRFVVIKRLHPAFRDDPAYVRRLLREAWIGENVAHPNVVRVEHAGEDAGGHFVVFEYVEGDTLESLLAHARSLPPPVVARIVLDALAGLAAAHDLQDPDGGKLSVVHRDVTPDNLLVGRDGVTRVADFGVADMGNGDRITGAAMRVGKLSYMAPEYLMQRQVDARSDLYSVGLSALRALTGALPWRAQSMADVVSRIVDEGVGDLSGASLSPALAAFVSRACALEPSARFSTAREMAAALSQAMDGTIATHAEVAGHVVRCAGPALQERRRMATPVPMRSPVAHLAAAAGFAVIEPTLTVERSPSGAHEVTRPDRPAPRPTPKPTKAAPPPDPARASATGLLSSLRDGVTRWLGKTA